MKNFSPNLLVTSGCLLLLAGVTNFLVLTAAEGSTPTSAAATEKDTVKLPEPRYAVPEHAVILSNRLRKTQNHRQWYPKNRRRLLLF